MRRTSRDRQRGFSYIGLLIVILIVGVMSAAALSSGSVMQRRAAEDELLFIGEQFQSAFKAYADATPPGARRYPAQLGDLLRDPRLPVTRRYLRKLYRDPLTGQAEWGVVEAPGGGLFGVYSRSDETPIRVAGFEDWFARFEGATKYSDWVFSGE
jgi:type II secretory pathway pseudopilin PulG